MIYEVVKSVCIPFLEQFFTRQLSPRPKLFIYCFNVSVECQFLKVLDLS